MLNAATSRQPKASVIVLNHNGLKYLAQTIPPLLQQNYPDYEVLVVDNNSADGSVDYLESLADGDPRLRVIKNAENLGYGGGKNIGVQKAKGDFILLLDEDILIDEPNILSDLLRLYGQLRRPGFVSLLLREESDQDKTKLYGGFISLFSVYSNRPFLIKNLTRQKYHEASSPDGGALFFKKSTFTALGGYDTSQPYYLDVGDIGLRAAIYGYRTYVYDKRIFRHLGTARKKNIEGWLWKYGYHFSGLSRVMFKNYRQRNLLIAYPYFCLYCLAKTILNTLRYKDVRVIGRFIFSVRYFFKNLSTLKLSRRNIQAGRTVPTDVFLNVKRPV